MWRLLSQSCSKLFVSLLRKWLFLGNTMANKTVSTNLNWCVHSSAETLKPYIWIRGRDCPNLSSFSHDLSVSLIASARIWLWRYANNVGLAEVNDRCMRHQNGWVFHHRTETGKPKWDVLLKLYFAAIKICACLSSVRSVISLVE